MATFLSTPKVLQLIYLLLLKIIISSSQPTYFYTTCANDKGNYTQNSPYQTNLHQLLSDLSSQPPSTTFYNSTRGQIPNRAYGMFYCRADIVPQLCNSCVRAASRMILTNCTNQREAVVWYQECTLRYANRPIVGVDDSDDYIYSWWFDDENVTNPRQLQEVLSNTMGRLVMRAAYNGSSHGYATGVVPFPPYPDMYCLVQCSPDILGLSCERCLRRIYTDMQSCCYGGRVWVMMFRANCQMRYDMVPFYTPLASPPSLSHDSEPAARGVVFYILRVGVPVAAFIILILLIVIVFFFCRRNKPHIPTGNDKPPSSHTDPIIEESNNTESLQYSLDTIRIATENFSNDNKLGQGGFGAVYKGRLPDGQEVAVKRLSEDSRQGIREFTTEVQLVAKLQHRNLVKLLGFCIEGEEKLLVYEFVSNLSLDRFLFDPQKRQYLDWETRFKIILGIARGMLYLHEDSRFKIVHRDMKTSNILLDEEMNPKIADFGMAKLMKIDHTQTNTSKIFGTFGYMAPEYAAAGVFSIKSDVYSLGVILLEIISGRSNNLFSRSLGKDSLISYARRLWNTGAILELVDPSMGSNFSRAEVLRCIQVGLFCVEEDPSSRPTMESVLLILHNNSSDIQFPPLPSPRSSHASLQGEHVGREVDQFGSHSGNTTQHFTDLYPR